MPSMSIIGKPSSSEDKMDEIEQRLADMKRTINEAKETPSFLRTMKAPFLMSKNSDREYRDSMEFGNDLTNIDDAAIKLRTLTDRIGRLEDDKPSFKGLNTWDVVIPPLPITATLEDVIKKVNTLIQRNQRQDRVQ